MAEDFRAQTLITPDWRLAAPHHETATLIQLRITIPPKQITKSAGMAVKSTRAWVPCNDRSYRQQVRQLASCGNSHFRRQRRCAYTVNTGSAGGMANVLLAEVQNIKGFGDIAQIFPSRFRSASHHFACAKQGATQLLFQLANLLADRSRS